jgi:hypothetical protein
LAFRVVTCRVIHSASVSGFRVQLPGAWQSLKQAFKDVVSSEKVLKNEGLVNGNLHAPEFGNNFSRVFHLWTWRSSHACLSLGPDELFFDSFAELAAPVAKTSASSTLLTTAATSVPEAQSEIDMKHEADYEDISEIERVRYVSLLRLRQTLRLTILVRTSTYPWDSSGLKRSPPPAR